VRCCIIAPLIGRNNDFRRGLRLNRTCRRMIPKFASLDAISDLADFNLPDGILARAR
jgi:hypothetical protein